MSPFEPTDYSDFEPIGEPGEAEAVETVSVSLVDALAGSRTYRLLSPLRIDGKVVRVVRLRHLQQAEIDSFIDKPYREMVAAACSLPGAAISALIWPDSEAIHAMFDDMLPLGKAN